MKTLTMLLLSAFCLTASAQTKNTKSHIDTKQAVTDDGKTLHLTISSNSEGKKLHYDHTFKVAGLSKKQKDALVKSVQDSLGIVPPPAPNGIGKR